MNIQPAHALDATQIETDVAILGGGAAGLALAANLESDCIVVESGIDRLEPARHGWQHAINRGEATNVDSLRVRGIGGATLRWTGRCIELSPQDLERRPWLDCPGWPIGADELAGWYRRAWSELGIADESVCAEPEAVDTLREWTRRAPQLEPARWLYADHPRTGIVRFGELFSPAFAAPGKRLIYAAHAVELLHEGGVARAMRVVDRQGRGLLIRARRFVLAGGCVENSRFLLATRARGGRLLAQTGRWLGRGFMQHLRVDAGTLDFEPERYRQLQRAFGQGRTADGMPHETGLALEPDHARAQRIGNASMVLRYVPDRGPWPGDWLPVLTGRLRGSRPIHRRGSALLEIDAEQATDPDSRVTLADELDPFGQPRAAIDWRIAETDRRTVAETVERFDRLLQANGLGAMRLPAGVRADALAAQCRRDSNHSLGGTRMGEPGDSVVDANLKVHGAGNLWVAGGSVFASGGHANPTLTILALALRLAAHLDGERGR